MRDLATLNGFEILPWDVWGSQPEPNVMLSDEELKFFDEIALLTADPDAKISTR